MTKHYDNSRIIKHMMAADFLFLKNVCSMCRIESHKTCLGMWKGWRPQNGDLYELNDIQMWRFFIFVLH